MVNVDDEVDVSEWVYYDPSWNHHKIDGLVVYVCDGCGTKNLKTCWGLPDMMDDLCSDCYWSYRNGHLSFTPTRKLLKYWLENLPQQ